MAAITSGATLRDHDYMSEAVTLAARIPRRPWPNPPVGAVVVKDGAVIASGAHLGPGQPHAERVALERAGAAARGATLYCTLEPCNHQGRTPPCAPAVAASGLERVVIGVGDPNPNVSGGGCECLREAGIDVTVGVAADACLELIWPFVVTDGFQRPYLELKSAASLDGRFGLPSAAGGAMERGATRPSKPAYLTGEQARRDVHRRRRWVDLVLVGEGTVREDRPRLDARLVTADCACPAADPAAGYVDSDLSFAGRLNRDRYYVFYGESVAAQASSRRLPPGAEAVGCASIGNHVDPQDLIRCAAHRGIATIMLEGGPRLAAAFLAAGLVDRWIHYTAPVVVGAGPTWPDTFTDDGNNEPTRFALTRCRRIGPDLCTVHDRREFAALLRELTVAKAATAAVTLADHRKP
jgi:diaminohydroxyphosphoribosylaminopyrimidine deaminase/5-amino-6-(5-phosphoribosylamino)uracil reductase